MRVISMTVKIIIEISHIQEDIVKTTNSILKIKG